MAIDEPNFLFDNVAVESLESDFVEKVVAINRVSRTVAGGRRIRFRAMVVIGNRHGKVGVGSAKANDVQSAIMKAGNKAKKSLITVPLINETIPYQVKKTYGTTSILLKPAPKGHSIIAGGPVRSVVELAGITNIVSKSLGSSNALNGAMATFLALKKIDTRKR